MLVKYEQSILCKSYLELVSIIGVIDWLMHFQFWTVHTFLEIGNTVLETGVLSVILEK